MFKVNNIDTRATSLASYWCLYCQLWTYVTPCSSVSIVNSEQLTGTHCQCDIEVLNNHKEIQLTSAVDFKHCKLSHRRPILPFYTPWKHQKIRQPNIPFLYPLKTESQIDQYFSSIPLKTSNTLSFCDGFRGYRKGLLAGYGLFSILNHIHMICSKSLSSFKWEFNSVVGNMFRKSKVCCFRLTCSNHVLSGDIN